MNYKLFPAQTVHITTRLALGYGGSDGETRQMTQSIRKTDSVTLIETLSEQLLQETEEVLGSPDISLKTLSSAAPET